MDGRRLRLAGSLGYLLLLAGSVVLGLSLGLILGLGEGEGWVDYNARVGSYHGSLSFVGFHTLYDPATNETIGVVGSGLLACTVYAPPESSLYIQLSSPEPTSATIHVSAGGLEGRGNVILGPDAGRVYLASFTDRGVYHLVVNVSIHGDPWTIMTVERVTLYSPSGQDAPASLYAGAALGIILVAVGYRFSGGFLWWNSLSSLIPGVLLVSSFLYGLERPVDGFAVCNAYSNLPVGWSPEASLGQAKLAARTLLASESLVSTRLWTLYMVLAAAVLGVTAAGTLESGLGEFEELVFGSKARLYAGKVLFPLAVFALAPGLLLALATILLYGSLSLPAAAGSVTLVLIVLPSLLLLAGVVAAISYATGRASLGIMAGTMLALLPHVYPSWSPRIGVPLEEIIASTGLSRIHGADEFAGAMLWLYPQVLAPRAWILAAGLLLLAVAYYLYRVREP